MYTITYEDDRDCVNMFTIQQSTSTLMPSAGAVYIDTELNIHGTLKVFVFSFGLWPFLSGESKVT